MTWTATERKDRLLGGNFVVIDIRDEQAKNVCRLQAYYGDPAAIEEMRARARLICQAEAMLNLITDMQAWPVEPSVGSYAGILVKKARAIIAAAEHPAQDTNDD